MISSTTFCKIIKNDLLKTHLIQQEGVLASLNIDSKRRLFTHESCLEAQILFSLEYHFIVILFSVLIKVSTIW